MEGLNLMAFHNNPKYKEHFRLIAQLLEEVENVTLHKWEVEHEPLSIAEIDTYLQQNNVNVTGAGVFWTMLTQSDKVRIVKATDDKSQGSVYPREEAES